MLLPIQTDKHFIFVLHQHILPARPKDEVKYWGSKSLSGSSDLWLTKNRILGVSIPTLMLLALVGGEDNFYISYQLRKMQPHSQIWQYYTVIMYLPVWINSHDANCFSVLKRNEFDFYRPIPQSKLIGQISCWRSSPTFNFKLPISAKMCTHKLKQTSVYSLLLKLFTECNHVNN